MLNRTTSILIGIVLILIVGISVYVEKQIRPVTQITPLSDEVGINPNTTVPVTANPSTSNPVKPASPPTNSDSTPTPVTAPTGITLAQVAQHNSRESCWSAINGTVYDLTSWIPNHPGGEGRILKICGKDGSSSYNGEHGGSSRITKILVGFKLDVLAQ